ncbi:zinc finger protein 653 [Bufo bufo]|uniref:zinc finger protein 653 n=1 Tax=Bufo bufo TaxID=8384 RepID=UPI001ABE8938|nr:zinc finger protein 653 [Bufo bufo]
MAAPVIETPGSEEEEDDDYGRKGRGRPRLNDTDRVKRRLESRKKYDCRRVYLGEAHGAWVLRRDRGGGDSGGEAWSDARLAAHLLALETSCQGKSDGELQLNPPHRTRQKHGVNSLLNLMTWYNDHKSHCPHEPTLSELDTSHLLYTTAVWQCQAGHHFFQDLRCPLKTLNHKGCDEEVSSDDSSSRPTPVIQVTEICQESDTQVHTLYSESMTDGEDQGTEETVMCVPMGQEALGQVVTAANCPSQVIIIAGPAYEALAAEGIQLDVDGGSGDEEACTTLEAVTEFSQTEPGEHDDDSSEEVLTDDNVLYTLKAAQSELDQAQGVILASQQDEAASLEEPMGPVILETGKYQLENVLQIKVPEKKRNRRAPVIDADGVPEVFHCPYEGCPRVYTALNSFQNHVNLIHRKGRTKVCPEAGCGKKFYLTNHLRRHMIIHTGVREFICETCGKSFKRKSHLEVHRRTHTGETPLQCEVCGFQCRQRASLNWHMRKHDSMIQYSFSCEQCGKLFEKRDSVKFHVLKSHPDWSATSEVKPEDALLSGVQVKEDDAVSSKDRISAPPTTNLVPF